MSEGYIEAKMMYFHLAYLGKSYKIFSFFGEQPFILSPKCSQKWITRGKNTLLRWDKDNIKA